MLPEKNPFPSSGSERSEQHELVPIHEEDQEQENSIKLNGILSELINRQLIAEIIIVS